MKLTQTQISGWLVQENMHQWFINRFTDDDADYQEVLNALSEDDRTYAAHSLMDMVGAIEEPYCIDGFCENPKHLFIAGSLIISGSIHINGWIRAGKNIESEKSISADCGIIAGCGIQSGGSIRSKGSIKAGTRINAARSIDAGDSIECGGSIVSDEDIYAAEGITAGTKRNAMSDEVDAIFSSDDIKSFQAMQELCVISNGWLNTFDAFNGDNNAFRLQAKGSIVSGKGIVSATTIKAGEGIVASESILSSGNIHAGGNVTAGHSIQTPNNIWTDGGIRAKGKLSANSIRAARDIDINGNVDVKHSLKSDASINVVGNIIVGEDTPYIIEKIIAVEAIKVSGNLRCNGHIQGVSIEVGESVHAKGNICTKFDITVGRKLVSGALIESARGTISARLGIYAEKSIHAGQCIHGGQEIVAGDDYGVFAATTIPRSQWDIKGQVISITVPRNLISGYWMIDLTIPIIKVIGVGDAGSHVVEYMFENQIEGVEFCSINTDRHALKKSKVETLLQIGEAVTKGSGTGGNAEIGREAALGDSDAIAELIDGADMVFIIAAMGGGTGTGAAPVIAKIAKELGMLTVAVVTKPCLTEVSRTQVAVEGLDELLKQVDTLIAITPEIAVEALGDAVTNVVAQSICNDAVYNAVSSITNIINIQGTVAVDFADVRTVLSDMGLGQTASASATGPDRAHIAAEQAVARLLVEGVNLENASSLLVNITTSSSFRMKEYYDVVNTIKAVTSEDATVIVGNVFDESMGDGMRVTIVATFGTIKHPT